MPGTPIINIDLGAVLSAIQAVRENISGEIDSLRGEINNVRLEIRASRIESKEDLAKHHSDDKEEFGAINTSLGSMKTAHDTARGFIYAVLALQGVIVTVSALIQAIHMIKHGG